MHFDGMRVIESEWLTEAGEPVTETRRYTWLQRLLTADIPPWRSTYQVTYRPQVPSQSAYRLANGAIVMHPVMAQRLRANLFGAPPLSGGRNA